MSDYEKKDREEIFSVPVRAGKRTYFFDVKATKANDYFLTITESKKRTNDDGTFFFEKHKIFIYKEDFEKFMKGATDAVKYIVDKQGAYVQPPQVEKEITDSKHTSSDTGFSDVNFDDLGK